MDITRPRPVRAVTAGPGPAFHKRWSALTVLWIVIGLAFLYVIVQTAATVVLLYVKFPDIMAQASHGDPTELIRLATTPAGLAKLLTASGFLAIQLPTTAVMVAATIIIAAGALGATARDLGFRRRLSSGALGLALGAGLVLFIVSIVLQLLQEKLLGPHPQQIALILEHHRGVLALLLDLISAAVLAPLWEETFFRGVLFTAFVQRMPFWWAASLSGFLFAAAHLDKWNLLPLWVLGIGLAYVYYRTGNIWASIATHATINGIDLLLTALAAAHHT